MPKNSCYGGIAYTLNIMEWSQNILNYFELSYSPFDNCSDVFPKIPKTYTMAFLFRHLKTSWLPPSNSFNEPNGFLAVI